MPDNMIHNIPVEMLSEHQKASELIPEMTKEEFDDFLKSIKDEGVKVPIDITKDKKVLDGRHRLRAANLLGIEKLPAIYHDFSDEEAIRFIRDTAIERRSLTPIQKHKVVEDSEELIKSIYEAGKKTQGKRNDLTFSSRDEKVDVPHNSVKQVSEMTGLSEAQVSRARKLKREDPVSYEEVVNGEKSLYKAYYSLPTVTNKQAESRGLKKPIKGGDAKRTTEKPESKQEKPKPKSQPRNQQPPELTPEEIKAEMLDANVEALFMHLNELAGFVDRTENLMEVIGKAIEKDSVSFYELVRVLEKTINQIKSEVA